MKLPLKETNQPLGKKQQAIHFDKNQRLYQIWDLAFPHALS